MPLVGDDERFRHEPEPDVPKPSWNRPRLERQRQRPWRAPRPGGPGTIRYPPHPLPPAPAAPLYSDVLAWLVDKMPTPPVEIVDPLPPSFMWVIAENTWVSQGDIKAFWLAREKRTTGNFWPGWRWGNPHRLKENP